MSLGIKQIWRVRPRTVRPLSLIPGDCWTCCLLHSSVASRQAQRPEGFTSTTTPVVTSVKSTNEPRKVAGSITEARESHTDLPTASQLLPSLPGATFMERLAQVPVRRHEPRHSVVIEAPIKYSRKQETHRAAYKLRKAVIRQSLLERTRVATQKHTPDWRMILWDLDRWTPDQSGPGNDHAVKVIIPRDVSKFLLLDGQDSLKEIRDRTKCSLKMHSGNGELERPYLVASGEVSAIAVAVQEILQLSKCATVVSLLGQNAVVQPAGLEVADGQDNSDLPVSFRSHSITTSPRHLLKCRVRDLPLPAVWTVASFDAYVTRLVRSRPAPHLASRPDDSEPSHQEAVIDQLLKAFRDPATRSVLSAAAFKKALSYMTKDGVTHRQRARALFASMRAIGFKMDTEVFNILAESAVAAKDLLCFASVLDHMHRSGFAPDLWTWILFLRMIEAEEVKRYILHSMDRKGLFRFPGTVKLISDELAQADTERCVQQGKDLATLLADRDELYGPGWATRSSLNRIIEVLGRHGRLDESLRLAEMMMTHSKCSPTTTTLNIIMTHCKVSRSPMIRALQVLQKFGHRASELPNGTTYHLLFEMAWRRGMPHTVGLIWRYACLVGETSYRMRYRITGLLQGHSRGSQIKRRLPSGFSPPGSQACDMPASRIAVDSLAARLLFYEYAVCHSSKETLERPPAGDITAADIAHWYSTELGSWEPADAIVDLLAEAIARDTQLHGDIAEDTSKAWQPLELQLARRARATGDSSRRNSKELVELLSKVSLNASI